MPPQGLNRFDVMRAFGRDDLFDTVGPRYGLEIWSWQKLQQKLRNWEIVWPA
jgi:hypothetical protein